MNNDKIPPTIPLTMANIRYIVPISLWFVEYTQRFQPDGFE
jgi:hypothetical protein